VSSHSDGRRCPHCKQELGSGGSEAPEVASNHVDRNPVSWKTDDALARLIVKQRLKPPKTPKAKARRRRRRR